MTSYVWTGHYDENHPPVAWDGGRDWGTALEDGREVALMDVLAKQFDQWGPERARRVLAYLNARYTGVDNREGRA